MSNEPGEKNFDPSEILFLRQGPVFTETQPAAAAQANRPASGLPAGATQSLRSMGRRAAAQPIELATDDVDEAIEALEHEVAQAPASLQSEDHQFWALVAMLRKKAADLQAREIVSRPGMTDAEKEELGRHHIMTVVNDEAAELVRNSGQKSDWTVDFRERLVRAIFDEMFRLGRYQALIDDPNVENIHIHGFDEVYVDYGGGRMEKRGPIAMSDEHLMQDLQFFANRNGEEAREFSSAHPDLDMDLQGTVRLAAIAKPIVERPSAVLRIHRYINITLNELVNLKLLSQEMADFLALCVQAKLTIVICGEGGDGKTTLMRALADQIGPMEQIVTIEKERELHLKKLGSRILPPFPLQYRPGTGERDQHGNSPGEYSLEACFEKALRMNSKRIMVGEVRGLEIVSMIQAMQSGAGTMSTTHADSPDDCIDRLAGLGIERYGKEYMLEQLGRHIDFVVQLGQIVDEDGKQRRKVTHISEVQPAEHGQVSTQDIYRLTPGEYMARFIRIPTQERLLAKLERAGLNTDHLGTGRRL